MTDELETMIVWVFFKKIINSDVFKQSKRRAQVYCNNPVALDYNQ